SQMAQSYYQSEQESITGSQEEEHITNGVRWKVQTITFAATPVIRWYSLDFQFPGQFLFLTQKMKGHEKSGGRMMASLGKIGFKQSLSIYGFRDEEHTPNLKRAEQLSNIDPLLEPHFSAFSSDPGRASRILNPGVVNLLANWAERYPLQQGASDQLAVLFGPNGVYLSMLGLTNPEHLAELAALGAGLVSGQDASL
ncbi:MAG: hypothetical protein MUO76_04670, partial [Anaerolineaceae bacterium]|nr:hypothetical protein [Anaerolineaceae bacterium]